jgi:hypothetical protein
MNAKQIKPVCGTNAVAATGKLPARNLAPQPVHFEYSDGGAQLVCLAGSFNNWRPENAEMDPLGAGKWAKDLALPPGTYEYRFVVDGQWLMDPRAALHVPNPYGGENSIKVVPPVAPAAARMLAALPRPRQLAPGRS